MVIGTVYKVQPQPPEAAHTRWFPAGAVTLGKLAPYVTV